MLDFYIIVRSHLDIVFNAVKSFLFKPHVGPGAVRIEPTPFPDRRW